MVAILGVLAVVALVAVGVVTRVGGDDTAGEDRPSASTDAPTTSPVTSAPTSGPPPGLPGAGKCGGGDPLDRARHPRDGRVKGGGLAVRRPAGFLNVPRERDLPFADDVVTVSRAESDGGQALYALGSLDRSRYPDLRAAAGAVVGCLARSRLVFDQLLTPTRPRVFTGKVAGSPASGLDVDLAARGAREPRADLAVIVIDLGDPDHLSLFVAIVPPDDLPLARQRQRTASGLHRE